MSLALIATLGVLWPAQRAHAGFTTISNAASGEPGQGAVLDHIYGGDFTLEGDGVDYSNGTLSAVRVSDYLPSTSSAASPGPNGTDQLWSADSVAATAKVSFAELRSTSFGITNGASGGTYQPLFNIAGSGYSASGSGTIATAGQTFRFGIDTSFGVASSLPSDNTDGKDHLVTYQIDGLSGSDNTWMLFFDDYGDNGKDADFDFQDVVIQIQTPLKAPAVTSPIPEPASFMLIGGAAILALRRRRRPPL